MSEWKPNKPLGIVHAKRQDRGRGSVRQTDKRHRRRSEGKCQYCGRGITVPIETHLGLMPDCMAEYIKEKK